MRWEKSSRKYLEISKIFNRNKSSMFNIILTVYYTFRNNWNKRSGLKMNSKPTLNPWYIIPLWKSRSSGKTQMHIDMLALSAEPLIFPNISIYTWCWCIPENWLAWMLLLTWQCTFFCVCRLAWRRRANDMPIQKVNFSSVERWHE